MQYYGADRIEELITWLMGWPSGVKLNNDLDQFLGNVFLSFLAIWRSTWEDDGVIWEKKKMNMGYILYV